MVDASMSDEQLARKLRSYTGTWAGQAAAMFGTSKLDINRALSDHFGPVMHADLVLLYCRLEFVLTGLASGEMHGSRGTLVRDVALDADPDIVPVLRQLNTDLVTFLTERYGVGKSTTNKALHDRFGPIAQATPEQLMHRAAALVATCAVQQSRLEEEGIAPDVADQMKRRQGLHRRYTEMVKTVARIKGIPVGLINSEMYRLRGSVRDETADTLESRTQMLLDYYLPGQSIEDATQET